MAFALAPCTGARNSTAHGLAAGAAAPGEPGGRSWPRTAGEWRERLERVALRVAAPTHPCFVTNNRYITVVRGSQLAGFEVFLTGRF
jgi:hypothetical protein